MTKKDDNQHLYRVLFQNQGQVYEVYARNIYQSELYGFVEIEDYTFSNKSQVVIDPSEEKLRNEFESVQRSFHSHARRHKNRRGRKRRSGQNYCQRRQQGNSLPHASTN